jgi:hypothetical protein
MIRVERLFGPMAITEFCGECRPTMDGGTLCDCVRYNGALQKLHDRDPEAYRACFVPERGADD